MAYVVGITVRTTTSRPHLRGVVLNTGDPTFIRCFAHLASPAATADQLHSLGQDFASELAAQDELDAVIIREVGFARAAGLTDPVKNRLRAEGICLGAARAITSKAQVLDIKAIGALLGLSAADADARGSALASTHFGEPAAAALAAALL